MHDAREAPHPQQQSFTGTEPNDRPLSKQLIGRQSKPATDAIVHGVGSSAISFPPIDTMSTSLEDMLSRRNLSCGRSLRHRSFKVVASTVLYNTRVVSFRIKHCAATKGHMRSGKKGRRHHSPAVLIAAYVVFPSC